MKKIYMFLFVMAFVVSSFAQVNVTYICATDLLTGAEVEDETPVVDAIKAAKGGDHFNVTIYDYANVTEENLATLNAADVIIVGRGVNSGDIRDEPNVSVYTSITAPVIHTSVWVIRGDRLGYVTGGTVHQNSDPELVVTATIPDPNHTVFDGVELTDGKLDWTVGYTSDLTAEEGDAGGTVLATTEDGRILAIVHEAGIALYSGRTPQGARAYIGNGQDNVQPATYWNFADAAQPVFFNLIDYMASKKTSASSVAKETIKVYGVVGGIKVPAESNASVYSISGRVVAQNVNGDFVSCPKGMYIVKIGNAASKVMVTR